MKFLCSKAVILNEISIASRIISSKSYKSIYSNAMLTVENEKLIIKAKSSENKMGFQSEIKITDSVNGSTTVFCDKFMSILNNLPEGEIEFSLDDQEILTIVPTGKKINFQIKCSPSDTFPPISEEDKYEFFEFPQKTLSEMIKQTSFSMSDDLTKYMMTGTYLIKQDNNLIMVSTDGRRLSYISKELPSPISDFPQGKEGIIVLGKFLKLIETLSMDQGTILLGVSEKSISLKTERQIIISSLIDGKFPDYKKVIPESQKYKTILPKKDLSEAVNRVSIFTQQKAKRIFLIFTKEKVTIKSEDAEISAMAEEEISCDYDGPNMTFALNYQFLLDPLKCIESDKCSIQFSEQNRAVSLLSEPEDSYFHIMMPMVN